MSNDAIPDPHEIGASFVCAYCGNPMIEPYISCCGEIHFVPDEEESE